MNARVNHWKVAREAHWDRVKEAHGRCRSILDISKETGLTIAVIRSCLHDIGLPDPDGWQKQRSDKAILRGLAERTPHHEEVKRLLSAGWPVLRIAREIGLSRAVVNRCIEDLGLQRPDVSEGNRRSAAMTPEAERRARALAAHEAVKGRSPDRITRATQAAVRHTTMQYVGAGENEVANGLTERGIPVSPQAPVEGFNIDILSGRVVVEIHNNTSRPPATIQTLTRVARLMSKGYSILYIRTGANEPDVTPLALDRAADFIRECEGVSAPQFCCIRGNGEIDQTAENRVRAAFTEIGAYCRSIPHQV